VTIDAGRVSALVRKEWLEVRGTWAPWLPGLLTLPVLLLPFVLAVALPRLADEPLEDSEFAEQLTLVAPSWPAAAALPQRAAVQAFLFQQFLLLVVLVPVSGAMSLAAHSIIGEKQARTLEPLLASPLTKTELLAAKVLSALAPALLLEIGALALYLAGVALTADAGVLRVLLSWRTAWLVLVLAPLTTLAGLQLVVLSSTRARDSRSAQQVGVLVVLPLVGVVVAQGAGAFWLTIPVMAVVATVLAILWLALLAVSVAAFDGERILTRWR
jgi:ABC-2 type transport system permease protein